MCESIDYDFYHEVNDSTENSKQSNDNSAIKLDLDLDVSLEISSAEKSEGESKEKTLKERINNHLIPTDNYKKFSTNKYAKTGSLSLDEFNSNDSITGAHIRLNEVENLSIIDIDINHHKDQLMDESEVELTRKQIIDKCKSNNYVLGETPSGGFHIYCNNDDEFFNKFNISKNRITGINIKKGLDLDLLTSQFPDIISGVLLIGSRVIYDSSDEIKQSKFINGNYDSIINYSITDVLKTFDWTEYVENYFNKNFNSKAPVFNSVNPVTVEESNFISEPKYEHFDLPEETQIALINGLYGFVVHKSTHSGKTIKDEATLMLVFRAINELNTDLIDKAYAQVRNKCILTEHAEPNFDQVKRENLGKKHDFRSLINVIKYWNPDYYKTNVLPLIGGIHIEKFDLNDKFRLKDLCEKALNHKYRTLEAAANDVSRIYRFKHEGDKYLIEKGIDPETQTLKFNYITFKVAKEELSTIKLFPKTDNTDYTAWDAFLKYKHLFNFDKIVFNQLEDPKPDRNGYVPTIISFFHGYRYQKLPECNMKVIENYLKLIYEGISNSRDDVYNYILDWIANIAQNPGKRNMSAIVMKGNQGAGKNTFTDILAQLFVGYSEPNISAIDDIVGRWNSVIENKVLLVMNELMTAKDSYVQSMETLKTLITDPVMRIEEKFQPKRVSENVSNLIFISNNSKPIIIPKNDRRYLVITVNGKFVKDKKFFASLHNLPESFYDNLMTFFLNRDITQFDPTNVPWTQEKDALTDACRSDVEDFIVEIYDKLTTGILYKDLVECYNKFVHYEEDPKKFKRFKLEIQDKCINGGKFKTSKPFSDGKRREVYKLKPEYEDIYKPDAVDEEISEDPQNYI